MISACPSSRASARSTTAIARRWQLEIAKENSYVGRSVVGLPFYILRGAGDELVRVSSNEGSEGGKVVRRYSVDPKSGRID